MSFGGHVLDMINRIKANKAYSDHRRNRRNKIRDAFLKNASKRHEPLRKKEIPADELSKIRKQIRSDLQAQRKKAIGYSVLLSVVIVIVIWAIFTYL